MTPCINTRPPEPISTELYQDLNNICITWFVANQMALGWQIVKADL